jgi:AcrR family transcriptional regulator
MNDSQRDEIRKKIIKATEEIIKDQGLDQVSIRKVAKKVGYTPGSIYQYFENKDALIYELMRVGYQRIIDAISIPVSSDTIENQIKYKLSNYIETALKMPEYYKAIMLSEDPIILKNTSIFNVDNKLALSTLREMIQEGIDNNEFIEESVDVLLRYVWLSVFGLTIRLIIEGPIEKNDIETYIYKHLDLLFKGIRKGKK